MCSSYPTKILGVERRGLYQRQERHLNRGSEAELHKVFGRGGTSFLVGHEVVVVNTFATKRRKTGGCSIGPSYRQPPLGGANFGPFEYRR